MSTQRATSRCDCGGIIDIVPTASLWEFDWQCRDCTRCGNISWFHGVEPPTYLGEQLRLFGEQVRQGEAGQARRGSARLGRARHGRAELAYITGTQSFGQ